jgi:hypothetical protein
MQNPTLKQEVLDSLKHLPDDADIDEMMYRLYVIDKIHKSREAIKQYQNDLLAYSQAAESHCRALGFQIVESPRRLLVHENPQQVEVAAQQIVPRP